MSRAIQPRFRPGMHALHHLPPCVCVGFTGLNDMGLSGFCQPDLPRAMVHVLFRGLCGSPSFACNPTFDFPPGIVTSSGSPALKQLASCI